MSDSTQVENGEGFTVLPMGVSSIVPLPTRLRPEVLTSMKNNTSSTHPASKIDFLLQQALNTTPVY
jgi:hypothetical protein